MAAIFSSEDIGAVRYKKKKKKTENIVDVEMKKVWYTPLKRFSVRNTVQTVNEN